MRWHAQFLDNLHVGVYRTTVEGRFVFCNKTLAKTLGFPSAKELFGFPVAKLYRNIQDRGKFIQKIIRDGRADNYPLALKKRNGSPVTVSVSAGAVFDDEGLLVFIDGIVQKTRQARLEKDLANNGKSEKDARDCSDTSASEKEKFEGAKELAGGISHKMNQPLTIINNILSEILAEFDNTEENYRKIVKVQKQIFKINDIAKKIGNLKKYQSMDYVAGVKIVDIDRAV